MSNGYIEHVESILGPLSRAFRGDDAAGPNKFSIAVFEDQPRPGCKTYLTLGLSKHLFRNSAGNECTQELLFSCFSGYDETEVLRIPDTIGAILLKAHVAAEKGEIIPPHAPMVSGGTVDSAMLFDPLYFPETLDLYTGVIPNIRTVAILPLTRAEATYAVEHGWKALFSLIEEAQADLLDLKRSSVC